jgi:hypothetical protein
MNFNYMEYTICVRLRKYWNKTDNNTLTIS